MTTKPLRVTWKAALPGETSLRISRLTIEFDEINSPNYDAVTLMAQMIECLTCSSHSGSISCSVCLRKFRLLCSGVRICDEAKMTNYVSDLDDNIRECNGHPVRVCVRYSRGCGADGKLCPTSDLLKEKRDSL